MLGKRELDINVADKMSTAQFKAAWASLGVSITPGYIDAIFNKYGHDRNGLMPVNVRAEEGRCLGIMLCGFVCMQQHQPALQQTGVACVHAEFRLCAEPEGESL